SLVPLIPWLDPESAAAVQDIVQTIAARHLAVQAVILFGSVARRQERPVGDRDPSDINLFLIIYPTTRDPPAQYLTNEQDPAPPRTIGEAEYRRGRVLPPSAARDQHLLHASRLGPLGRVVHRERRARRHFAVGARPCTATPCTRHRAPYHGHVVGD